MSIVETLIDISHESSLGHAEKVSLRLIARDVKKLKKYAQHLPGCNRLTPIALVSPEGDIKCDCGLE